MRRTFAIALCLGLAPLSSLAAQWSLAADLGATSFSGASSDTASDPRSFRPSGTTVLALRLDRRFGRGGMGVALAYAAGGLALENSSVAAVRKDAMSLYGLAPEVSWRLAETAGGGHLAVHAGPVLDLWALSGARTRARAGAQAALSVDCPIGRRLAGSVRAGLALTGSPCDAGELPSEFERRAMWRHSVSVGLRHRL